MIYLNGALQKTFNYNYKITNSFIFHKNAGFKADLTGASNSTFHLGPLSFAKTCDISAGLIKALFQNRDTLRLAAANIVYGNPYQININYLDQQNGTNFRSDIRN